MARLTSVIMLAGLFFTTSFPSWAGNSGVLTAGVSNHNAKGFVCGLKTDGKVVCWGYSPLSNPPLDIFTQLSAGTYHVCGLKTDGSIVCWGEDDSGETSPPSGIYTQVASGDSHSCALKPDGTVICWGDNSYSKASPSSSIFTQITTGDNHACGLKSDGTVECWGNNDYDQSTPPAENFTYISAGIYSTCGLKTDGVGICWGYMSKTSLGFLTQLDTGTSSVCGLKADNTANCWERNDGDYLEAPSGTFTYIVTSYIFACGLRDNGFVTCWGEAPTPPTGITFKQPSDSQPPLPSEYEYTQADLDASYQDGYQEGQIACTNDPESCGIGSSSNTTIETPPSYSLGTGILTLPIVLLDGELAVGAELIIDTVTIPGEIIFRLKTVNNIEQTPDLPSVWNVSVNPTTVNAGDAQLISWQSSNQSWYLLYLYDTNNQPINTSAFLAPDCRAAGSDGSDGCIGQEKPSTRISDSWNIPAQLSQGSYKIKVAVWSSADRPARGAFSVPFTVR